jgi:hypothetical protein
MGTFYAMLLMDVGGAASIFYIIDLACHGHHTWRGKLGHDGCFWLHGSSRRTQAADEKPPHSCSLHPQCQLGEQSDYTVIIHIYIHRLNILWLLCVIIVHALDISWILLDMNPCFASLLLQVAVEGPRTPKGSAV